jgi:hypothetical protein
VEFSPPIGGVKVVILPFAGKGLEGALPDFGKNPKTMNKTWLLN